MILRILFSTLATIHLALAGPNLTAFRSEKLPAIQQTLQSMVDQHQIAGAVVYLERHGQKHFTTVGYRDLNTKTPLRQDDLFWLASMTKPLTAICILQLQDDGRLSVDDPVEKHLPEFKNLWMIQEQSPDRRVVVKAPRPITLRDLLTHTSGMGGDIPQPRPQVSLAELVAAYAREPLTFSPGDRWAYSNPGINTLGRVVEVVSGKDFFSFLKSRVLDPLAMKDTTFWPSATQAKRLSKCYTRKNGQLTENNVYFYSGELSDRRRTQFPAGGLYSTAIDMGRLYRMMLNGGETQNGRRILSREAVRQLTTTQTGEIKTGFTDGMSWGLGFQVVKSPQGLIAPLSAGTFGHGGAYTTQSWGEPAKDLVHVVMVQIGGQGDASTMRGEWVKVIEDAVAE